ncbi:MAG TPA: DUF3047 domain-containing protein [Candidatus Limnocylindrales bacterium]|nr:DUF3047 domain-containing protein [Candidatus Limnocylindrales bacterium]
MGRMEELRGAAQRWRTVRGRGLAPEPDRAAFRTAFARLLSNDAIARHAVLEIPSQRPPWTDTRIDLAAGQEVTLFGCGRTYLSRALDIWVPPQFQLWARVGENGEIFNGTRASNSFAAAQAGRLYVASYFPGQWGDRYGRVGSDIRAYARVDGGLTVVAIVWKHSAAAGLQALLRDAGDGGAAAAEIAAEAQRLASPPAPPPSWHYLWFLGQSDIYRQQDGCITCTTNGNVGILQTETPVDLTPQTRLSWEWKVDALPSQFAEDAVVSHDYMSIAVEFSDGRDITYYWSNRLPFDMGYWCPLDGWKDREFHIVVRSGPIGLGQWLAESRNVHEDYRRYIGDAPSRIVRVWLIANSLFQRLPGSCTYRSIRLSGVGSDIVVL